MSQTAAAPDPLTEAWSSQPGFSGWLRAVNHKQIGLRYIVTSFAFLLVGGIQALVMRTQLAVPDNDVVGAQAFNELFTLHGTTMMFLFAVPLLEGLAIYFLPLMLGTRDLPFPRLNAFGYWAFLFGGIFVYSSYLTGEIPDGGWFAYPPLSDAAFSPGRGLDFWLLGITLTEIAGIVGASEIVVGFFKRRAPGMSLDRIPLFAWAVLVMSVMILLAFPALVAGSLLLESDRALGTNFYNADAGGDPLLWQHLFWFFGHPEVYITFVPAAGIISMIVPVFARRTIAAYSLVVAALVATGIISFGLWVHHMFAVGLPLLALSLFSAASYLIVIPTSVEVFSWIVTLWRGRPSFRTPLLFVLAVAVVFIVGGITGIMVAAAPFDWQVHDSYFVVAHFHYVLIGGVVFPIFGALYYWFPKWTGRLLSDGLGQVSFWTMLVGFNLAFFPHHLLGLEGMPRRIPTYSETDGWGTENLLSTIGAFVLAVGIAVTLVNVAIALARGRGAGADPWQASSLEWLASSPPEPFNFRVLPVVRSGDPLWDEAGEPVDHDLSRLLDDLATPARPDREVIETSALRAEVERVVLLPGPSLLPLATALALSLALVGALLYAAPLLVAGLVATVVLLVVWGVTSTTLTLPADDERTLRVGVRSPETGSWGLVTGLWSVAVILGSLAFGYYLLMAEAAVWPPEGVDAPALALPLVATVLVVAAAAAAWWAARSLRGGRTGASVGALAAAALLTLLFAASLAVSLAGLDAAPLADAYGSIVAAVVGFQLVLAAALLLVLAVAVWQSRNGSAEREGSVMVGIAALLALFVAASWPVILATVYLAPRVA